RGARRLTIRTERTFTKLLQKDPVLLQISVQSGLLFVVQGLRRRASGQDEAAHHNNHLQDVNTPVSVTTPTPEQETPHGNCDSHTTLLGQITGPHIWRSMKPVPENFVK